MVCKCESMLLPCRQQLSPIFRNRKPYSSCARQLCVCMCVCVSVNIHARTHMSRNSNNNALRNHCAPSTTLLMVDVDTIDLKRTNCCMEECVSGEWASARVRARIVQIIGKECNKFDVNAIESHNNDRTARTSST